MNEINLIGLSGQLQNGKDTVADLIIKLTEKVSPPFNDGSVWKTRRFAGILKQMTALLIGCELSQLEDNDFKNAPLGEEWRRWYFVDKDKLQSSENEKRVSRFFESEDEANHYFNTEINDIPDGSELVSQILTPRLVLQILGTEGGRDVIHPNIWINATFGNIKKSDYIIVTDCRFPNEANGIKERKGILVRVVRPSLVSTSTHPSETSLNDYNDWDYVITNDGTFEDLERKVKDMLIHFNILEEVPNEV